jgi:hypothetical protein
MKTEQKDVSLWLALYIIREFCLITEQNLAKELFRLCPGIRILEDDLEELWMLGMIDVEQFDCADGYRLRATKRATTFLDKSWDNLKDALAPIVPNYQRAQ